MLGVVKMGCLGIILIFIALALFVSYPVPASIITLILIVTGIIASGKEKEKREENERLQNESRERAIQAYNDLKSKVTISDNVSEVNYKSGHAKLLNTENFMWVEKSNLCFFPANPPNSDTPTNIEKITLFKIPFNKIEYYATRGEVIQENKITGGGGGGSTIGGAVVGGVIAGGVGAVIGSRKKGDPIKSELVTHDTRETFLNFFDDKNVKHSMFFNFEDYSTFSEIIPEKSYEIVYTIKTNKILNKVVNENKSLNILDQIRELAKLKDEGLLTEEEFAEKKKSLLDKIG